MVSLKSILVASALMFATLTNVQAAVSPSYPSPGTIQTEGQQYNVTWTFDEKNSTQTYRIDFMTGSNDNQTVLSNIATGVKANALSYTYTAPYVTPNSAIYFFMFTGSQGDTAWTTRFGIVAPGGNLTTEPEKTQPNGDAIPWGQGALATASASASASSSVVASSSAVSVAVTPAASSSVVATVSPTVAAAASSTAVAQVVAASATSGTTVIKPVLGFVSAVIAGYLSL